MISGPRPEQVSMRRHRWPRNLKGRRCRSLGSGRALRTKREDGTVTGCYGPIRAMPHPYLNKLNPEQRRAVEHGIDGAVVSAGPLLVIAGAGSGKTSTLAHRVAHL